MKKETLQVINENGIAFNVVTVETGENYGRENCLVNDTGRQMVEFYDTRYNFTEHGQFVSRYFTETLLEREEGYGLNLDGGVEDWSISSDNFEQVRHWLKKKEFKNNTKIKLPKKLQGKISEIDFEGKEDGYWAYSTEGYYFEGMGRGCHSAHEYSQTELMKMLRTVKPCDSDCDCKRA